MKMEAYDSEFCLVTCERESGAVILTWKKFACGEDYRKPCHFAWQLLEKYLLTYLIVDARNGFEDDEADVEWGMSVLLPGIATTKCKVVCFIMNEVNEIEDEMDMWTKEFSKYFQVIRMKSYEEALRRISIES